MPTKQKDYERVVFTPEVIKEAVEELKAILSDQSELTSQSYTVRVSSEEKWYYDTEDEFFTDYRKGCELAHFEQSHRTDKDRGNIQLWYYGSGRSSISVSMRNGVDVEKVFNIIEANVKKCSLPKPRRKKSRKVKTKTFIGHGHDAQWRDLKDHLHEKHGLDVEAYEIGARAGLTIKEVLEDMLTNSSFAVLVFTGEDEDAEGKFHARENVIHELGLFQGHLGWRRAIVLLEKDVEEFSNIHGVTQIRFSKGNIMESFGDVLATIKREFSQKE